jgi:hypothetical protein
MPMIDKHGLVHIVISPEQKDFKGLLRCGAIYSTRPKVNTKWKPRRQPGGFNIEYVTRRTSRAPTCLMCIGRAPD